MQACKITLRKVCVLISAPKVNSMVQSHLLDYGQLNYDIFINDFIKIIVSVEFTVAVGMIFDKFYSTLIRLPSFVIIYPTL